MVAPAGGGSSSSPSFISARTFSCPTWRAGAAGTCPTFPTRRTAPWHRTGCARCSRPRPVDSTCTASARSTPGRGSFLTPVRTRPRPGAQAAGGRRGWNQCQPRSPDCRPTPAERTRLDLRWLPRRGTRRWRRRDRPRDPRDRRIAALLFRRHRPLAGANGGPRRVAHAGATKSALQLLGVPDEGRECRCRAARRSPPALSCSISLSWLRVQMTGGS